jgi:predicted regulator of amino acid metabolism with ACT domain
VARKNRSTLDQQRDETKARYKRGPRARRDVVPEEQLSDVELAVKKTHAIYLKATDFSYSYIADAVGLKRTTVKKWFEDPQMRNSVAEVHANFIDGAVKLLKTYAVELVEILVNVARTADDPKVVIQAATEALDRMGVTKVNKSESATTNTEKKEVEITDTTGLVDALRDAPPEVQAKAAQQMQDLEAVLKEHSK